MDTRNWICPALCGCEIQMNAKWSGEPVLTNPEKRVSYQHPIPFTITEIKIIHVCDEHAPLTRLGVETDPYPDFLGYIKRPIHNASEAESLYVHLFPIGGQNMLLDACGCVIHQIINRITGEIKIIEHPLYTKKCALHAHDDSLHTQALTFGLEQQNIAKRDEERDLNIIT